LFLPEPYIWGEGNKTPLMFHDFLVSPKATEDRAGNELAIQTWTSRFIVAPKLTVAPCHLGQNRLELGNSKSEGCAVGEDVSSRMCE
jgi:hypothetical protein